jgi:asparagine synthase (glutamine-hydrolysing)
MSDSEGKIWIVYNGEVYNFLELKKDLEKKYSFRSRTDTEVLIYLYKEYGKDMVHKLRGMFAFAIWDENKKELWLVRDRIGIKPLYYTFVGGKFIFASEIKAILKDPSVKREVNEEGFYHYLSFLTTPPPQTLFQGIYKIPAGHMLIVNAEGSYKLNEYWDVFDNVTPLYEKDEEFYTKRLLELFRESVKLRMVSDVPIGVFLSGGIDSSTNTALFSEFTNDVKTFSIGYREVEKYNEFKYARKVANIFNTKHHEVIIDVDDLIDFTKELVYYQDEPIADPVCVPVYYVAKLAKDSGVTVCQVGEGADELFCGYPSWIKFLRLNRALDLFSQLPLMNFSKPVIFKGAAFLSRPLNLSTSRYLEILRRWTENETIFWGGAEAYTEARKSKILSKDFKKRHENLSSFGVIQKYWRRFLERSPSLDYLSWMTYLDLRIRLPELLLMRVDKMTMAVSLEARVPFLDHKLIEWVMGIPYRIKVNGYLTKYIFKKTARQILPEDIVYRKKQGFSVPLLEWFRGEYGAFACEKILRFVKSEGFFDESGIREIINKRNGFLIWYVLNFVLWYERWISK